MTKQQGGFGVPAMEWISKAVLSCECSNIPGFCLLGLHCAIINVTYSETFQRKTSDLGLGCRKVTPIFLNMT